MPPQATNLTISPSQFPPDVQKFHQHALSRPDLYIGSMQPQLLNTFIPTFDIHNPTKRIFKPQQLISIPALDNIINDLLAFFITNTTISNQILVHVDPKDHFLSIWVDALVLPIDFNDKLGLHIADYRTTYPFLIDNLKIDYTPTIPLYPTTLPQTLASGTKASDNETSTPRRSSIPSLVIDEAEVASPAPAASQQTESKPTLTELQNDQKKVLRALKEQSRQPLFPLLHAQLFSTHSILKLSDGHQLYEHKYYDNMQSKTTQLTLDHQVVPTKYTHFTVYFDLQRFFGPLLPPDDGQEKTARSNQSRLNRFTTGLAAQIEKRCHELAVLTRHQIIFNGTPIQISTFPQLCQLYLPQQHNTTAQSQLVCGQIPDLCEFAVAINPYAASNTHLINPVLTQDISSLPSGVLSPTPQSDPNSSELVTSPSTLSNLTMNGSAPLLPQIISHVSFINTVNTPKGGNHVDCFIKQFFNQLAQHYHTMPKPSNLKSRLFFFFSLNTRGLTSSTPPATSSSESGKAELKLQINNPSPYARPQDLLLKLNITDLLSQLTIPTSFIETALPMVYSLHNNNTSLKSRQASIFTSRMPPVVSQQQQQQQQQEQLTITPASETDTTKTTTTTTPTASKPSQFPRKASIPSLSVTALPTTISTLPNSSVIFHPKLIDAKYAGVVDTTPPATADPQLIAQTATPTYLPARRPSIQPNQSTQGSPSSLLRANSVPLLNDDLQTPHSQLCTLIITQFDHHANLVQAALSTQQQNFYGIFHGLSAKKPLNPYTTSLKQLSEYTDLYDLAKILGLPLSPQHITTTFHSLHKTSQNDQQTNSQQPTHTSPTPSSTATPTATSPPTTTGTKATDSSTQPQWFHTKRYGRIMIVSDGDHEGHYWKASLLNLFAIFWPNLLTANGYITEFAFPLITVPIPAQAQELWQEYQEYSFYNEQSYQFWRSTPPLAYSPDVDLSTMLKMSRLDPYLHDPNPNSMNSKMKKKFLAAMDRSVRSRSPNDTNPTGILFSDDDDSDEDSEESSDRDEPHNTAATGGGFFESWFGWGGSSTTDQNSGKDQSLHRSSKSGAISAGDYRDGSQSTQITPKQDQFGGKKGNQDSMAISFSEFALDDDVKPFQVMSASPFVTPRKLGQNDQPPSTPQQNLDQFFTTPLRPTASGDLNSPSMNGSIPNNNNNNNNNNTSSNQTFNQLQFHHVDSFLSSPCYSPRNEALGLNSMYNLTMSSCTSSSANSQQPSSIHPQLDALQQLYQPALSKQGSIQTNSQHSTSGQTSHPNPLLQPSHPYGLKFHPTLSSFSLQQLRTYFTVIFQHQRPLYFDEAAFASFEFFFSPQYQAERTALIRLVSPSLYQHVPPNQYNMFASDAIGSQQHIELRNNPISPAALSVNPKIFLHTIATSNPMSTSTTTTIVLRRLDHMNENITYSNYLHNELLAYFVNLTEKTIPMLLDGLLPIQRQILYVLLTRSITEHSTTAIGQSILPHYPHLLSPPQTSTSQPPSTSPTYKLTANYANRDAKRFSLVGSSLQTPLISSESIPVTQFITELVNKLGSNLDIPMISALLMKLSQNCLGSLNFPLLELSANEISGTRHTIHPPLAHVPTSSSTTILTQSNMVLNVSLPIAHSTPQITPAQISSMSVGLNPLLFYLYHPDDILLYQYQLVTAASSQNDPFTAHPQEASTQFISPNSNNQLNLPSFYPIIPSILLYCTTPNVGFAGSYSSSFLRYNLLDIITNIRLLVSGSSPIQLTPFYNGFMGKVEQSLSNQSKFTTIGVVNDSSKSQNPPSDGVAGHCDEKYTVHITELPIGLNTQRMREILVKKQSQYEILSFSEHHTTSTVDFKVNLSPEIFTSISSSVGFVQFFQLFSSIECSNMWCYVHSHTLSTVHQLPHNLSPASPSPPSLSPHLTRHPSAALPPTPSRTSIHSSPFSPQHQQDNAANPILTLQHFANLNDIFKTWHQLRSPYYTARKRFLEERYEFISTVLTQRLEFINKVISGQINLFKHATLFDLVEKELASGTQFKPLPYYQFLQFSLRQDVELIHNFLKQQYELAVQRHKQEMLEESNKEKQSNAPLNAIVLPSSCKPQPMYGSISYLDNNQPYSQLSPQDQPDKSGGRRSVSRRMSVLYSTTASDTEDDDDDDDNGDDKPTSPTTNFGSFTRYAAHKSSTGQFNQQRSTYHGFSSISPRYSNYPPASSEHNAHHASQLGTMDNLPSFDLLQNNSIILDQLQLFDGYEYLLCIPFTIINQSLVTQLTQQISQVNKLGHVIQRTSANDLWMADLQQLETAWKTFLVQNRPF